MIEGMFPRFCRTHFSTSQRQKGKYTNLHWMWRTARRGSQAISFEENPRLWSYRSATCLFRSFLGNLPVSLRSVLVFLLLLVSEVVLSTFEMELAAGPQWIRGYFFSFFFFMWGVLQPQLQRSQFSLDHEHEYWKVPPKGWRRGLFFQHLGWLFTMIVIRVM